MELFKSHNLQWPKPSSEQRIQVSMWVPSSKKRAGQGPGPRDSPHHSSPPLSPAAWGWKRPLLPFPQSWGLRCGSWTRGAAQSISPSPAEQVYCKCVHLAGFMQFSKDLRSQERRVMLWPVGRSHKAPLDLNLRLLIKGQFWCRGRCVLAERARSWERGWLVRFRPVHILGQNRGDGGVL